MTAFAGWTADAVALVDRAIAAHGGVEQWQRVTTITLPFRHGSGLLLRVKGYGHTFCAPSEFEVHPHEGVAIFHRYPDDDHRGRYELGNVTIEHMNGRDAPIQSRDHRGTFAGLAKHRRWSPLDALYFFGYALCHYHVLPFSLPQSRLVRVLTDRDRPVGLDLLIPSGVHTHCPRQRFYFGDDGRIARHDYVADVIGAWARGAHYWEDYRRSSGLLIACRRRVMARMGRLPMPATALDIQLGAPSVRTNQP